MESRPTVLLVEADAADEMLARKAITNSEIDCDVRIARDGAEACHTLFENGDAPPTLVLLALAVPKVDGFEVLARIRASEKTKRLPVIVYSASGKRADIDKCFDLCANSYVRKVKDLEINETRLKLALYYWIAVNQNVYA
jgi:two-component system response regulator